MSAKSKLRKPAQQIQLIKFSHGGLREGAGRPNLTGKPAHLRRPSFHPDCPVWITINLAKDIPSLKSAEIFKHLIIGFGKAQKKGLRVVHYNIQPSTIHLLTESQGKAELESATKSLCTSFAKRMNLKLNRKGPVFKGRFTMQPLSSPIEVEEALLKIFEKPSTGALSSTATCGQKARYLLFKAGIQINKKGLAENLKESDKKVIESIKIKSELTLLRDI